jgi:hypothetical protein
MSGKICDTPDGVALDFDVRTKHLANEWLQSSQAHDKQLVFGYEVGYVNMRGCARR